MFFVFLALPITNIRNIIRLEAEYFTYYYFIIA